MARSRRSIPPGAAGLPVWFAALQLNTQGGPKRLLSNAALPFEQDPAFAGKFSFDKFQRKLFVEGSLPWRPNPPQGKYELEDSDELEAVRWVENFGVPIDRKLVMYAIALAAYARTFHPVEDYFASLPLWDTTPRCETWTVDYLGVEDTPLVRAMSCAWMVSAVARIIQPGCQADYALVLEGAQGDMRRGKSSALRALSQPWFTDDIAPLGSKDAAEQCVGKWVIELSELDAMLRSDPAHTKSFISRRIGRFRWSYDPAVREYPRQNVFAGTVNDQTWNRDPTGNRRFWPMWCNYVNVDGLEMARDQLWAEALERYHLGEHWWIDDQNLVAEAREVQEQRYVSDPWEDRIRRNLDARIDHYYSNGITSFTGFITIDDILNSLDVPFDRRDRQHQMRAAHILQRAGWTRRRLSFDANGNVTTSNTIWTTRIARGWRYVPPGYDPVTHNLPPKK